MKRATSMAAAFVNAAMRTPDSNWIQRCVADRAKHTEIGVVKEDSIHVHVSNKTRAAIAIKQRVFV